MKRDLVALYLGIKEGRLPWHAKTVALCATAYALSPIDLIPDFIPILGYLDDLIIIPLLLTLTVRLVPQEVMQELREKADKILEQQVPSSITGACIVVGIWLAILFFSLYLWSSSSEPK